MELKVIHFSPELVLLHPTKVKMKKKVEFFFVLTFLKYISTFQQLPLIHSSADVCSNVMLSMQRLCETAVSDSFWHAIFHVHKGCETTVCDSSKCTHWLWSLSACCGMLTIFGMPWCLCTMVVKLLCFDRFEFFCAR